jgi:hypothetical protein
MKQRRQKAGVWLAFETAVAVEHRRGVAGEGQPLLVDETCCAVPSRDGYQTCSTFAISGQPARPAVPQLGLRMRLRGSTEDRRRIVEAREGQECFRTMSSAVIPAEPMPRQGQDAKRLSMKSKTSTTLLAF